MVNIFGEKQDAMTLDKILRECLKREKEVEELTKEEVEFYNEKFHTYDKDLDEKLSKNEYDTMVRENNLAPKDEIIRNDTNRNTNNSNKNQDLISFGTFVLMTVFVILFIEKEGFLLFFVIATCVNIYTRMHEILVRPPSWKSQLGPLCMDEWDFERFLKDVRGRRNPFLSFNDYIDTIAEKDSKKHIRLMRGKFVDQVTNRLSSLYGHTYLGCDQAPKSMYSKSFEYIFGATYEQQTDKRNSKVRILIMEKKKLKYLAEKLIDTDFKHSNIEAENSNRKYLEYCLTREKHLKLLWQIYKKQKNQDDKRERIENTIEQERYNYLVGSVYINQLIEIDKK